MSPTLSEALEQALRYPRRCLIFTEFLLAEELSPSDLAKRLDIELNAAAHHIRSLAKSGLIEVTRRVPYRGGVSQKFYRVVPSLRLSLLARSAAAAASAPGVKPEERHVLYLGHLLVAANVLSWGHHHYRDFDPAALDSLFRHPRLGAVAFGPLPRSALAELAQLVSDYLDRQWKDGLPRGPQQRDFVVFAALPDFLTPES